MAKIYNEMIYLIWKADVATTSKCLTLSWHTKMKKELVQQNSIYFNFSEVDIKLNKPTKWNELYLNKEVAYYSKSSKC